MGIARLDLNVGLTALLAAFLDTGLVCSAYVAIQAVQFLSNSFEKSSSSDMCNNNNVHNAIWRVLPLFMIPMVVCCFVVFPVSSSMSLRCSVLSGGVEQSSVLLAPLRGA